MSEKCKCTAHGVCEMDGRIWPRRDEDQVPAEVRKKGNLREEIIMQALQKRLQPALRSQGSHWLDNSA